MQRGCCFLYKSSFLGTELIICSNKRILIRGFLLFRIVYKLKPFFVMLPWSFIGVSVNFLCSQGISVVSLLPDRMVIISLRNGWVLLLERNIPHILQTFSLLQRICDWILLIDLSHITLDSLWVPRSLRGQDIKLHSVTSPVSIVFL